MKTVGPSQNFPLTAVISQAHGARRAFSFWKMAGSTIYIRAGNGEKGLQLCDSVSRLSSLAFAWDWQPCKVLWEMWWTRRCWKSTSKSMGTLMIFGCHGRQLCCCPFRGDVTYVTIHTSVQLFQLNCTISSFSHDLSWVIKTFMKPGLVKATDLRPFGFVTFKDSAAAQHFVDWSPHKVPDATVEIIAKWKHRHSAIQFHQKLDEISHTDSQFQKKQNFPCQVGSLIRHARICKSAQEKHLDGRQRSHPVTLQLGSLNR